MHCKECGNEIPDGAKACAFCGAYGILGAKAAKPSCLKLTIIITSCVFVFAFIAAILMPSNYLAKAKSRHTGCLQSLHTLSKGLQSYLTENNDFHKLSQSVGEGNEICDQIVPGAEKPADCAGKVAQIMQQSCLDYKIVVNKPAPFQYEITGHSKEKTSCGICVTETGYCPTRYSGEEPSDSPCKRSCVAAGINSTAVCPH